MWEFNIGGTQHRCKVNSDGDTWDLGEIIEVYGEENSDAIMCGEEVCPNCYSSHIVDYTGNDDLGKAKWMLYAPISSGTSANQVSIRQLMCDGNCSLLSAIDTIIDSGKETVHNNNVALILGEFNGANEDEAYRNYMNYAKELGIDNASYYKEQIVFKGIAKPELTKSKFTLDSSMTGLESAISRGELFVREKVTIWTERRYKIKGDVTPESLVDDLNNGDWRHWDYDSRDTEEYLDDTQEPINGAKTLEVYTANNERIGGN
jgi:hypothetical protein